MYKEDFGFSVGHASHKVNYTTKWMGNDLVVHVYGGDCPHVGAVAIACPRPSLKDTNAVSATASVFSMIGHKEDEIARSISLHLATNLSSNVVVVAGIHFDNANEDDLKGIINNTMKATETLVEKILKS